MRFGSTYITEPNRIIQAIGKHVITQNTLSGAGVGICIDESAQFGIIISGLEIVERGLSILGLTARTIYSHYVFHPIFGLFDKEYVFQKYECTTEWGLLSAFPQVL